MLKAAFAEGRLTREDHSERVRRALRSRTYAELAELSAGLPAGPLGTLPPRPPGAIAAYLADSQDRMCRGHQKEADALIKRRMARAQASNPAGWRVIADASARLSLPHLPGGLATRLKAAENDLVLHARLLAEAAAGFPGRPDDFGSALAEDRDTGRAVSRLAGRPYP